MSNRRLREKLLEGRASVSSDLTHYADSFTDLLLAIVINLTTTPSKCTTATSQTVLVALSGWIYATGTEIGTM
jgi:hypothetical protein